MNNSRIEKAIENILREAGYKKIVCIGFGGMISDDGEIIAIDGFNRQRVFNFKTKDDVIYIKNKNTKQIIFEKCISSYQEPFSFTINK